MLVAVPPQRRAAVPPGTIAMRRRWPHSLPPAIFTPLALVLLHVLASSPVPPSHDQHFHLLPPSRGPAAGTALRLVTSPSICPHLSAPSFPCSPSWRSTTAHLPCQQPTSPCVPLLSLPSLPPGPLQKSLLLSSLALPPFLLLARRTPPGSSRHLGSVLNLTLPPQLSLSSLSACARGLSLCRLHSPPTPGLQHFHQCCVCLPC